MIRLVFSSAQPDHLRVVDDGVEHHETLDRVVQREGASQGAVGHTDGGVERSLVDVIDARAVVAAVVHRRILKPHELREELPGLMSVDDAAEPGVLAWDADASVQHDRGQEACLTLGEALLGNGRDALVKPDFAAACAPR